MNAALRAVSLSGLIVLMPMVLNAQRFGFSIGAPAPQTSGTVSGGSSAASAPQMPPLPRPLPTPAVVPLPSLQLTLKPLNLLSNHLSPPQINFALDLRKPLLPAHCHSLSTQLRREVSLKCVSILQLRDSQAGRVYPPHRSRPCPAQSTQTLPIGFADRFQGILVSDKRTSNSTGFPQQALPKALSVDESTIARKR